MWVRLFWWMAIAGRAALWVAIAWFIMRLLHG